MPEEVEELQDNEILLPRGETLLAAAAARVNAEPLHYLELDRDGLRGSVAAAQHCRLAAAASEHLGLPYSDTLKECACLRSSPEILRHLGKCGLCNGAVFKAQNSCAVSAKQM